MSARVNHDSIAELHRLGWSAPKIAARVGCSERTVSRWRVANGVGMPLQENAGLPVAPERLAAARRMLAEGASQKDTAVTLRMSTATVRKYFPGQMWTQEQAGSYAQMVRRFNRLEAFVMEKSA